MNLVLGILNGPSRDEARGHGLCQSHFDACLYPYRNLGLDFCPYRSHDPGPSCLCLLNREVVGPRSDAI